MKKRLFATVAFFFFLAAGFGVFLRPLLYTLTPLQRHYLGAYLASSWHASDPKATTGIQWIWKFKPATEADEKKPGKKSGPKFQYELALEGDVLPIPARELLWKGDVLPFWMTRKAELDGWAGVEQGLSTEVNSAKLAALLRDGFFEGEPAWRFFVQPIILLGLGCVLLWMLQRWRDVGRERNRWNPPVPLWRKAGQKLIDSRARLRRTLASREKPLALPPAATSVRVLEARPEPSLVPEPRPVKPSAAAISSVPKVSKPKAQEAIWDEAKGLE
ncbi:MAG: hypothetical protein WB439_10650 [Acidobacteriaceae bacterium]